jgi:hypothetical protein
MYLDPDGKNSSGSSLIFSTNIYENGLHTKQAARHCASLVQEVGTHSACLVRTPSFIRIGRFLLESAHH